MPYESYLLQTRIMQNVGKYKYDFCLFYDTRVKLVKKEKEIEEEKLNFNFKFNLKKFIIFWDLHLLYGI